MGKTGKAALPSIANARAKLATAQDELEAATAANVDLQKQHEEARHALSYARSDVDRAIGAVVQSDAAVLKLIAEYERERRHLSELRQAVELVLGYFPHQARLSVLAERLNPWPPPPPARRLEWERAIAALESDADAPLPI
jgi:chromosome segregation ATPase